MKSDKGLEKALKKDIERGINSGEYPELFNGNDVVQLMLQSQLLGRKEGREQSEELEHSLRNTIIEKLDIIIDLRQQLAEKDESFKIIKDIIATGEKVTVIDIGERDKRRKKKTEMDKLLDEEIEVTQ